jgi:hypothetical protein
MSSTDQFGGCVGEVLEQHPVDSHRRPRCGLHGLIGAQILAARQRCKRVSPSASANRRPPFAVWSSAPGSRIGCWTSGDQRRPPGRGIPGAGEVLARLIPAYAVRIHGEAGTLRETTRRWGGRRHSAGRRLGGDLNVRGETVPRDRPTGGPSSAWPTRTASRPDSTLRSIDRVEQVRDTRKRSADGQARGPLRAWWLPEQPWNQPAGGRGTRRTRGSRAGEYRIGITCGMPVAGIGWGNSRRAPHAVTDRRFGVSAEPTQGPVRSAGPWVRAREAS